MPCPPNELGVIVPFVTIENSRANTGSAVSVDGMRSLLAHSGTACRAPTETQRRRNWLNRIERHHHPIEKRRKEP